MISAYTDYAQKFDYHQVLDQDSITYKEKIHFLPEFLKQLAIEEERGKTLSGCYEKYAGCLIVDHCQGRSINESKKKFCPAEGTIQDETCPDLLQKECQKDSSLSLCKDECLRNPHGTSCNGKNRCNVAVRDFCRMNKDQPLCNKYLNRCLSNYLPCLREDKNSSLCGRQAEHHGFSRG